MASQSNAKAGRTNIGEQDPDTGSEVGADENARAVETGEFPARAADPGSSAFGPWQSQAEAQLYAYLERAREPQPARFPPLDALSARLGEFGAPRPAEAEPAETGVSQETAGSLAADAQAGVHLKWFEEKFGELKHLVKRSEADKREIAMINARLAEIIDRVDRLSEALPEKRAMAAVEEQLAALSSHLDSAREQEALEAYRISRAAKEIFHAARQVEGVRNSFDAASKNTITQFNRTVADAAAKAASVTAERVTKALADSGPQKSLTRMEEELRALNERSREESERTAAALDRVHNTLREFLEQGQASRRADPFTPGASFASAGDRKRMGVHMPIGADAPHFAKSNKDFAAGAPKRPPLDGLTSRQTDRPKMDLEREIEQPAQPGLSPRYAEPAMQAPADRRERAAQQNTRAARNALGRQSLVRDDDRAFPLVGLVVVAIVLLLACAALLYLRMSGERSSLHLSPAPEKSAASNPAAQKAAPGDLRPAVASSFRSHTAQSAGLPALLSATDGGAGNSAQKSEDGADSVQLLTRAASRGDKDAQFRIGYRFLNDAAVPSNAAAAARWLTRAAEQGHVESEFLLASIFEQGTGVPRDEAQAMSWYRKAAEAGHARAMHNLAVLLATWANPRNYREAAVWFSRAAEAGVTDSQYNLAVLYERGLGEAQNDSMAYFWYSVAASSGDRDAKLQSGRLRGALAPEEADALQKKAARWQPSSPPPAPEKSANGTQG